MREAMAARRPAPEKVAGDLELAKVVLADLSVQDEELSVADEELRAQIAELERLRGALERERTNYLDLFDDAPVPYIVTDLRGSIVEANAAALRMLGVDARIAKRRSLAAFVDDAELLLDAVASAEPGSVLEIDVGLRPRAGSAIAASFAGRVSGAGDRVRWLVRDVSAHNLRRDVNERKEARTAATNVDLTRALRDNQDLLVRERALSQRLQTANDAKDRFFAVLSHDLRGPLNAVLGWTGLLRREHLDAKTRDKALATIERNALAQCDLIDELLDVSRIGAGKMQLEMRLVDLGDLARKSMDAMLPAARAKEVDIVDETQRTPVLVLADAARIQQILSNLLTNALKFTPKGGRITVGLAASSTARLSVTDTGKGIAPDVLAHVFECFRQDGESSTGRQGLGLGLYIVKHLVEMHGGVVDAKSEGEGKGSSFTITLPLSASQTDGAAVPEATQSSPVLVAAQSTKVVLEGVRVLLVDDEADTRDLLAAALGRHGAQVMTVADGGAALEAFEVFVPDVVVSDIGLPDLDGHDLVRRLRAKASGAACAAVAVSGFATTDDARRAISAGFDAHLRKPFLASDLIAAVRSVLDDRDAGL